MQVSRYHPLLVVLHWALAFLIIAALTLGFLGLAATPNTAPQKIDGLRAHMTGGLLILVLMGVRLIVRMGSSRPPQATAGSAILDRIASVSHYGFYVLVFAMGVTGIATALLAGLPSIVFGHTGAPLPTSFLVYPTRIAHGYIALALAGLIVTHVGAALYHQLVRKDRLLRRMFFGRRTAADQTSQQ